jgi:DNA replication protein DnaC
LNENSIFYVSPPEPSNTYCPDCGKEIMQFVAAGVLRLKKCDCLIEQEKKETARMRIFKLQGLSKIPKEYKNSLFGNYKVRKGTEFAHKACIAYVDKYDTYLEQGLGFILIGNTGSGKTRLACAVANELINRGHSAVFVKLSELYDYVNANYGQLPEEIYLSKFIILDDFGVDKTVSTKNSKELTLYKVLDHRINYRLPTIITTNIPQDKISANIEDARIISRLEDESKFKKIVISAADYRRGKNDS